MTFWIVQGLGIASLVFLATSFQMKTKEKLLIFSMLALTAYTIQYFLTGAITGAVINLVAIGRCIVFYVYSKRHLNPSIIVLAIFLFLMVVVTIFTWKSTLSIIPLLASTLNICGKWQNSMKLLRISSASAAVLWFVYDFYAGMYTAMLTDVFIIVSSTIALWRFRQRP